MPQRWNKIVIALIFVIFCGVLIFVSFFVFGNADSKITTASCENKTDEELLCWRGLIQSALKKQGVAAAFDVIEKAYSFYPDCHGFAHFIGEKAFKLFSDKKEITLGAKTHYCGYGFYHGFMEALLQSGGSMQEARSFCFYVGEKLAAVSSDARGACYHGIGHGAVDGGDPRSWGYPQKMIDPGLALCESVSETEREKYRCVTGVFNALEILSSDPTYKLKEIKEDPFSFCATQPETYKEPCYTNMIPVLLRLTGNNLQEVAHFIEAIEENEGDYEMRSVVISALFHEYARLYPEEMGDAKRGILMCRSLARELRLACIEGLAGGHMKYGKPKEEYRNGLAFCKSSALFEEERDACFRQIVSTLSVWYSREKAAAICRMVEDTYRQFCDLGI